MKIRRIRLRRLLFLGLVVAASVVCSEAPLLGAPGKWAPPARYERVGGAHETARSGAYEPPAGFGVDEPASRRTEPTAEELEVIATYRERESISEHTLPDGRPVDIVASIPSPNTSGVTKANVASTIATLVIMANSSGGFRNMFGDDPTAGQHADVQSFLSKYTDAGAQVISNDAMGEAALVKALQATAASHEATIVVGHAVRDHGVTLLVLPDGTRVSTEALARRVPEANIILLTCYSRDLDPHSAISLNEAFAVWAYATSLDRSPTSALPLQDAPVGADRKSVAAMEARISAVVARANAQSSVHPRVGVMWTSIDHGHGRWLVEATRDTEPNVSRLVMVAPAVLGHALLIIVMIVIPKVGGNQSTKVRLLVALQQRRRAVTISSFGLVLIAGMSGCVYLIFWNYLNNVGNPESVEPLSVWAGGIGTAQAALSAMIARTTPLGSLLGRVTHLLGGVIIGVWRGIGEYIKLIVRDGKDLVNAASTAAFLGWLVSWATSYCELWLPPLVFVGAFLIPLPMLVVVCCAGSAAAAGKGQSAFGER